jgi:hypothetical protein
MRATRGDGMEYVKCAIYEKTYKRGSAPCETGGTWEGNSTCPQCSYYRNRLIPPKIDLRESLKKPAQGNYANRKLQASNRGVEERLSELAFNREYRSDFKKIMGRILSEGKNIPSFSTARAVVLGWEEAKQKGWREYLEKYPLKLFLEKVKSILKKGNVNEHWIVIPKEYSDFRRRWDLQCFFDPSKPWPEGFNPFIYRPPVIPCIGPTNNARSIPIDQRLLVVRHWELINPDDDPYKVFIEIDRRQPRKLIQEKINKMLETLDRFKKIQNKSLRGRHSNRYRQLSMLSEIYDEKCKGKGLSRNKEAELISQYPRVGLKPSTIRKDYLKALRQPLKI